MKRRLLLVAHRSGAPEATGVGQVTVGSPGPSLASVGTPLSSEDEPVLWMPTSIGVRRFRVPRKALHLAWLGGVGPRVDGRVLGVAGRRTSCTYCTRPSRW